MNPTKSLFVLFFFLTSGMSAIFSSGAYAQNAPVTTAGTVSGATPGAISIPITVTGFANIGAITLSLDYNYSVMHFIQGTPHPQLVPFAIGENDLGTGYHRVVMGWFKPA
jgi:hypothetical protein